MAGSDTQNIVPPAAIAMWIGAVLWQVGYDSIYAYVDVRDDKMLGLRSTAMRFADRGKAWIGGFYIVTVALWLYGGAAMGMHWPYYVVLACVAGHFFWQLRVFNWAVPIGNLLLFGANIWVGVRWF